MVFRNPRSSAWEILVQIHFNCINLLKHTSTLLASIYMNSMPITKGKTICHTNFILKIPLCLPKKTSLVCLKLVIDLFQKFAVKIKTLCTTK